MEDYPQYVTSRYSSLHSIKKEQPSFVQHFVPASVCLQQIAEMRSLKKEVHRQMQIHGDYKVGGGKSPKNIFRVDLDLW